MKVERIPQTPPPPLDLVVITLSIAEAEELYRFLSYVGAGGYSAVSELCRKLRDTVK